MAEYILKNKTNDIYCESRALSYEEEGNDIYYLAKECLDKHNIKYSRHQAKVISQKDYDEFDEVYVMDEYNLARIFRQINDYKKIIKKLSDKDIEDPWYTRNFETVYRQIDEAIDRLI